METAHVTQPRRRSYTLWIVIGVIILLGLWIMTTYNGLVGSRAGVDASWSQVETQYQRRFDLVPNLVNTVKGAADFEQSTLQAVTEARTKWMGAAGNRDNQIAAAGEFDSALSRLLVTVEAYPQLQATQAFRDLMTQIEGTENRIATARRDYNESVRGYNVAVRTFPRNLVAGMLGFAPEEFFDAAEGSDTAPTVDFSE